MPITCLPFFHLLLRSGIHSPPLPPPYFQSPHFLVTLLPWAEELRGRQFSGFCVVLFSLSSPPPLFASSSLPSVLPFSNLEGDCPGGNSEHGHLQCQDNQAEESGGGVPPSDPQLLASWCPAAQPRLLVGWFEILPLSSFLSPFPLLSLLFS